MKRPEPHRQIGLRLFLLGGALAVVSGLTMDIREAISTERANRRPDNCVGQINSNVAVSREQLANFLTVSERGAKNTVLDILQMPYCDLPEIEVRAGVPAERSVYRLAFDPQTWLVVLFEGDEYAGYQFRVVR